MRQTRGCDVRSGADRRLGYRFHDTVALGPLRACCVGGQTHHAGNYNDDCHALVSCTLPAYMSNHTTKPYYVPFRALTVEVRI